MKKGKENPSTNVYGVSEAWTLNPSLISSACCHGSIRNTFPYKDERQKYYSLLTMRIASSMWPNGASPPTYFWLSKGRLCKKSPRFLSQAHLIGPFASENVTLTLIMSKKNLKCPLSLKPTTVELICHRCYLLEQFYDILQCDVIRT